MTPLEGCDSRFKLRCWQGVARTDPPYEVFCDDRVALRARAVGLIGDGAYSLVELSAWNDELNDWVRMERIGTG